MGRFLPALTASRLQAGTYLLGIALFSIAFLVFLNSSISFVVTDVIGRTRGVGDAVGSLGFADELLALVACPLWGLLSDRVGVRTVAVLGYVIVGLSLVCLVQSRNVYPDLLLGRLGFSVGGAACSTMVTAVLPAMVAKRAESDDDDGDGDGDGEAHRHGAENGHADSPSERLSRNGSFLGHGTTPSVSSQLTITPGRYASQSRSRSRHAKLPEPSQTSPSDPHAGSSQLAGFVGMFTGIGALLALAVFLPLPAYFQSRGDSPARSVQYSFYIVGAIAFCVALCIFFGLRDLPGEEGKSLSALWRPSTSSTAKFDPEEASAPSPASPSWRTLVTAPLKLGFTDSSIGLGYLGGFVARASSVGISLFIPLFVNAYFVRTDLCTSNPSNLPDVKANCERAYKLAAALSGIAETAALICAPLFGWLGGRVASGKPEWPLLGASAIGILGYVSFGLLKNPDAFHGDQGSAWAFPAVIAIGISQIGSIVCSLGLLGRGINRGGADRQVVQARHSRSGPVEGTETAPLLPSESFTPLAPSEHRGQLKGSIAGMYSLAGGAGILLLTKLGGVLFDRWTPGAPFFMLAIFNALLLVAVLAVGGGRALWRRREKLLEDE